MSTVFSRRSFLKYTAVAAGRYQPAGRLLRRRSFYFYQDRWKQHRAEGQIHPDCA